MSESSLARRKEEEAMGAGELHREKGGEQAKDKGVHEASVPDDSEDGGQCGLGPCAPRCLQHCSTLMLFTLTLAFSGLCAMVQNPVFVSQVTSIERQFGMNSTQIGVLMSANDIGFLLLVLLVSHFAQSAHKPKVLAGASVVFGICALGIAAMNFVRPTSLQGLDVSTNGSHHRTEQDQYLCTPINSNSSLHDACSVDKADNADSNLLLVTIIGFLLAGQGATKATKSPLGLTYIDNNVPHRSKTGLYVGILNTVILFGPPLGFALGGAISRIPVDLSDTILSSEDPRWIGAWWIGFLVAGALTLLLALPMSCFPRRLPSGARNKRLPATEPELGKETQKSPDQNETRKDLNGLDPYDPAKTNVQAKELSGPATQNHSQGGFLNMLRELPLSLKRLWLNPVYVLLLLAMSTLIFSAVGFNSFLIKYVERQFALPSWKSSYILGLSQLVFSGLGTMAGGVLVSRLRLTRRGALRCVLVSSMVSIIFSAVSIGLGCDSEPMVGLGNTGSDYVVDNGLSKCSCDVTQFLPVCDGNQTYLSPCHAGCATAANATHFTDCTLAAKQEVTAGSCSAGCKYLIPYIAVKVLSSAFICSVITPSYVTIMRSLSEKDKMLGIGMLSFMMSLLGFIPGPIAFGAIIDTSCVIWTSTCGETGACALYDLKKLRHSYIGMEVGVQLVAFSFFLLSLLVLMREVRSGRTTDDDHPKRQSIVIEEGEGESKVNGFGKGELSDRKSQGRNSVVLEMKKR